MNSQGLFTKTLFTVALYSFSCEGVVRSVEDLEIKLFKQGYSKKAVEAILKWFDFSEKKGVASF